MSELENIKVKGKNLKSYFEECQSLENSQERKNANKIYKYLLSNTEIDREI